MTVGPQRLVPPPLPHIRGQRITYPCSPCLLPSDASPPLRAKKKESFFDDETSTTTSSEDAEYEDSKPAVVHSSLKTMIDQLHTIIPDRSIDRKNITTFVKITERRGGSDEKSRAQREVLKQEELSRTKEELEGLSTSSVSSEDLDTIERAVESISSPRFCGLRIDGSLGKILNMPVESTTKYKKMVRKKLYKYYKDEKRFRKSCVGILPGGLSLVCMSQPPEPKYPPGGLTQQLSPISSEGILSDILSELGGEGESEEEDFAALFEQGEKEILEAAAVGSRFSEESGGGGKIDSRLPRRVGPSADIFTTTFQVGFPQRQPNFLVELHRHEMLPDRAATQEIQKIQEEREEKQLEIEQRRNRCIKTCPQFCEEMDLCGVCLERLEELPEGLRRKEVTRPAEITEFWQLSHDREDPIWIFRGRVVKYLDFTEECMIP